MQEWTDVWFWLSPMQSCHITSRFFTLLVYRRWLHPQKQMLNKKARNIYIFFKVHWNFFLNWNVMFKNWSTMIFFDGRTFEIRIYIYICFWSEEDHYVTYICKWFVNYTFLVLLSIKQWNVNLGGWSGENSYWSCGWLQTFGRSSKVCIPLLGW